MTSLLLEKPWDLGLRLITVSAWSLFCCYPLDDPGQTKLALDRLKEATIDFGVAQIEAGADALTLPDHATGDLVSGEYYERYLRDLHTGVRRSDSHPADSPYLRTDGGQNGIYRSDGNGSFPLRFQESNPASLWK